MLRSKRPVYLVIILAVGAVAAVLLGRAALSRAWSNAGMVVLTRALRTSEAGAMPGVALTQTEALMRTALEVDGGNAAAHRRLGFFLWERGDSERAGEEWRAGGIPPRDFTRVASQGRSADDLERALDWSLRAVAIAPSDSFLLYLAGALLEDQGNDVQALDLLSRAIDADNFTRDWAQTNSHFKRAEILHRMGRDAEAMADYEWVLGPQPDHYWAVIRLGSLMWEVNRDSARAEGLLQRAVAVAPDDKWAYGYLGSLYEDTGRLDDALQMYRKVLELDPDDRTARDRVEQLSSGGKP